MMVDKIVKAVLFFLYASVTTWGTGYAVFWLGQSGWWFAMSTFLVFLYAGLNAEVDKTKKT